MNDNYDLGTKLVGYGTALLGQIAAAAIALCFSSVWISVLVYIISAVVMALLSAALGLYINIAHSDKVEVLGAVVGKAAGKVRGLFTRKAVSHD